MFSPAIVQTRVAPVVHISEIRGAFDTGMTFTMPAFGVAALNGQGQGVLRYQLCTQTSQGVTCEQRAMRLDCRYLPVHPSGFSMGN